MGVILAGVSHKSCPIKLRETLSARSAAEALAQLKEQRFEEAVALNTCNRFELCAVVPDADPAPFLKRLTSMLEGWSGGLLSEYVYELSGGEAARHLFAVASGLDSLVVGEAEILGQVKQAYESALEIGMTGKVTNVLFQRALHVGKLVRTQTGIASGQLSVASVSVALAERIFGSLKDRSVLILGAGQTAELTARHLVSAHARRLTIANRTWERGLELATRLEASAVQWKDFPEVLAEVDIVVGSTGAPHPVVTRPLVEGAMAARKGRPLFLIDIAMPRDVDPSVHELESVYLYSMEDLQGIARENLSRRQGEIDAAERLVAEKAAEFERWLDGVASGERPTLKHALEEPAASAE